MAYSGSGCKGKSIFLELAVSSRESRPSPGVPNPFGLCEAPNDEPRPQREYILCEHTRLPIRPRAMPCRPLGVCGQIGPTDTEAFAGVEFRPQPQRRIHPPQILQIKARPSPHEGGWSMGPPRRPCQFNKEHKMCRPKSVTAGEGCLIRANILGRTCCRAESAAPKGGHQGDTGPKGIAVRTGTFSRWSK